MLKIVFFDLKDTPIPTAKGWKNPQSFDEYTVITNFISSIGEKNVVDMSYFSRWHYVVSCAITYRDDELLTCPKCTQELTHEFTFCPHCGARLN